MILRVLQISIKQSDIGRVADVCSNLSKNFHDYCLFNIFDQIVVGIVFSCFLNKKTTKNIVLRYSMTNTQYFCVDESLKQQKTSSNARQGSQHDCKIPQKLFERWEINCVFRLSLRLFTQIMEFETKQASKNFWDRSLILKIKGNEVKSTNFLTLVALCLKINDGLVVLRLLFFYMPSNADGICRNVGKNLRRPALHAIKIHSGKISTRITSSNTLTDLYTLFLPKKPSLSSI